MGQAAVPATKSHGQVADSERPGTGQDAGGAEAEQAARKSTQKKALYNILQQSWIFQILLSSNDQIAVLQKSRITVNLNFSSIIFIVFRITFLSKMLPKCYRSVRLQNLKIR